jgi:hypothetical protein
MEMFVSYEGISDDRWCSSKRCSLQLHPPENPIRIFLERATIDCIQVSCETKNA